MTLPRLATYSVKGAVRYGAVVDGGIVDLSARHAKDYPTLREVVAGRKAREPRRRSRVPHARSRAR
ncbi:hypothetical protein ACVWWG_005745 [Bradyrhizobium sp. LB7.2]